MLSDFGATVTYPLGSSVIFSPNKNLTGGMQQVQTTGVSSYQSIQASLAKRFSNGTQFLAAYTGGEATDYYSGGNVNELINNPGDQFNWRLNRGPADFNRKHRLVISGVCARNPACGSGCCGPNPAARRRPGAGRRCA